MGLATLLLKTQLESVQEISDKLDISCLDFYLDGYDGDNFTLSEPSQTKLSKSKQSKQSIDDNSEKNPDNISDEIYETICSELKKQVGEDSEADFIGFSTYIWNRQQVVFLSKQLKEKFPMLTILAGGAEASADPDSLLKDGSFDFVIKGEAELTLTRVIKELLAGNRGLHIPGVFNNINKGNINKGNINTANINEPEITTDVPLVMNLDSIPSVFLSGNVDLQNQKAILWELSRGCKFLCTYCYEGLGVKTVRHFSLPRIRAELQLFESHQITQIFVLDPIFNQDPKRTRDILQLIQEISPHIHFIFEVRTEYLTEEIVSMFSEIHCTLQIGLESANPVALKSVKRGFHPQKYREKINLLNEYGIAFGLDLIYGLPEDDLPGFKESLDYAFNLQPNHLDIFPLSVLPGTELNRDKERFQLNVTSGAPYTLLSSPTFSVDDMTEARHLSNAIDIFYNRGMAVPWFFMVVETLELQPSEFFVEFSQWPLLLNKKEISVSEILELQLGFLKTKFDTTEHQKSFEVLKDIVQYHAALNQSMLAGPFSDLDDQSGTASRSGDVDASRGNQLYQLTPSVKIIELHFSLEDLMNVGEITFDEFLLTTSPAKNSVLVYNYHGEVVSEAIDTIWATLLQQFANANSIDKVCTNKHYKDLERVEIVGFIEFSLEQNILHLR